MKGMNALAMLNPCYLDSLIYLMFLRCVNIKEVLYSQVSGMKRDSETASSASYTPPVFDVARLSRQEVDRLLWLDIQPARLGRAESG